MRNDDIAQYWDENAEVWARQVRGGYDTYRDLYNNPAFCEFVGDLSGLSVLDAGCGEGYNTRLLAKKGGRMTGVDVSAEMIRLARLEEEREPLGNRYEVASMSDLSSFGDETFDVVVSTMALMDCADYEGAVREFWRVLRPGGLLAFSVLHPWTGWARGWERDESGEVVGCIVGNYFQGGSEVERWRFGAAADREEVQPFTTVYFRRTLTDYVNGACAAGFTMERIAEPRPTEEACHADPRLRQWHLVPQSLFIRARKRAM